MGLGPMVSSGRTNQDRGTLGLLLLLFVKQAERVGSCSSPAWAGKAVGSTVGGSPALRSGWHSCASGPCLCLGPLMPRGPRLPLDSGPAGLAAMDALWLDYHGRQDWLQRCELPTSVGVDPLTPRDTVDMGREKLLRFDTKQLMTEIQTLLPKR